MAVRCVLSGLARVALLLALLSIGLLSALLRAAEAHAGEGLLGFGAELSRWQAGRLHSEPRRLAVNGVELSLVSLSTSLGLPEVLDHFHQHCRGASPLYVPSEWLSGWIHDMPALPWSPDGVVRLESESDGVLACVAADNPLELRDFAAAMQEFGASGDLGSLGELRYVYARRSGNTTSLLVIWTQGDRALLELFPSGRDAPGSDPEDIPRPATSRRILSGKEHGMPYAITAYVTASSTPTELAGWYERVLVDDGWSIVRSNDGSLVVRRGDRLAIVALIPLGAARVAVSIAELS